MNVPECSDTTTVEIKILTMDRQPYTLQINKNISVPALKEQVKNVTGVLERHQRLFYLGRELKDDCPLSDVKDGYALHLVVRKPVDLGCSRKRQNPSTDIIP